MPFFLQKIEELDFHIDYFYSIFASPRIRGKRTFCESSSAGRARPCQGRGRGFESRLSLHFCPGGGIGRHAGLKILWPLGRAGSSPARGTLSLVT